MSEQKKTELENTANPQEEACSRQPVMKKAEDKIEGIAQNVADGAKKVYKTIEDSTVAGYKAVEDGVVGSYKAVENSVVDGYKAVENSVVNGFGKITDKFVGAFLTKKGETVEQAKERLAAEQKAREEKQAERIHTPHGNNKPEK